MQAEIEFREMGPGRSRRFSPAWIVLPMALALLCMNLHGRTVQHRGNWLPDPLSCRRQHGWPITFLEQCPRKHHRRHQVIMHSTGAPPISFHARWLILDLAIGVLIIGGAVLVLRRSDELRLRASLIPAAVLCVLLAMGGASHLFRWQQLFGGLMTVGGVVTTIRVVRTTE